MKIPGILKKTTNIYCHTWDSAFFYLVLRRIIKANKPKMLITSQALSPSVRKWSGVIRDEKLLPWHWQATANYANVRGEVVDCFASLCQFRQLKKHFNCTGWGLYKNIEKSLDWQSFMYTMEQFSKYSFWVWLSTAPTLICLISLNPNSYI